MTNQTTAQVADSGYPELPKILQHMIDDYVPVSLRIQVKSALMDYSRSSRLNGGGAESLLKELLEAYEAPYPTESMIGERQATIDAQNAWGKRQGVAVKRAKAFLEAAAQASPIPTGPETLCTVCGLGRHVACHRLILDGPNKGEPLDHPFTISTSAAPQLPAPEVASDEQIIARCKEHGITWIEPDGEEDGFPGSFDMVKMSEMRALLSGVPHELARATEGPRAALATPQPPAAQQSYAIALQRAIEAHCRGEKVPEPERSQCPHHADKLDKALSPVSQQSEHGGQVAAPDEVDMATLRAALRARGYRDDGVPRVVTDRVLHMAREDQDLINMLQTLNSQYKARAALTQAEATPAPVVQPRETPLEKSNRLGAEIDYLIAHFNDPTTPSIPENIQQSARTLLEQLESEFPRQEVSLGHVRRMANFCATPTPAALKPAEAVQAEGVSIERAIDRVLEALHTFSGQDNYLLTQHAPKNQEDYYEVIHLDTLRKIVTTALSTPPEQTGGGK